MTDHTVCTIEELPEGARKIVEVDGRQDRRLQLRRRAATRSRTAARTTTARSPRATFDADACTVECPRHGSLFDLTHRHARRPSPPTCRSRPSRSASRTARSSWRLTDMATPETASPTHAERWLKDINADYKEKFGFHDPETGYAYKAPKGLNARGRRGDLRVQGRAAVDARVPPQGARALPGAPDADVGRPTLAEIDFDNIHYFVRASEQARAAPGTTSPRTSRTPSTGSASPRPSASSSPASAPSTSPRSSTTRSTRTSRSRA